MFGSCDTAAEARAFACCSVVLRGKAVLRGFDVIFFPRAGDVTDVVSSPWEMGLPGDLTQLMKYDSTWLLAVLHCGAVSPGDSLFFGDLYC